MSTVYLDVTKALQKAVANNPTTLPIQYENISFNSNNASYIRATTIFNNIEMAELGNGGCNKYQGLLQIDLFCPSNKGGLDTLLVDLDLLVTYFAPGTIFEGLVRINLTNVEGRINGDGWLLQPISINWDAYASRPVI